MNRPRRIVSVPKRFSEERQHFHPSFGGSAGSNNGHTTGRATDAGHSSYTGCRGNPGTDMLYDHTDMSFSVSHHPDPDFDPDEVSEDDEDYKELLGIRGKGRALEEEWLSYDESSEDSDYYEEQSQLATQTDWHSAYNAVRKRAALTVARLFYFIPAYYMICSSYFTPWWLSLCVR